MYNLHFIRLFAGICSRQLSTNCTLWSLKKQSVILNKLMNVKAKSKRKWYESPQDTLPTVGHVSKTIHVTGKSGLRRMAMLNKMFMKNISDLLSTGSFSQEILGKGLEISKVSITPNFHTLRVYWVCSRDAHAMDQILQRTSRVLRHELSQLKLMGEVPTIVFVKDEQSSRLNEIDERLKIADYGEGYEPKIIGHMLKADFSLNTTISADVMAKIKKLESESDIEETSLPEMTHNIYGLDHLTMMNRMRGARKTNEEAWHRMKTVDAGVVHRNNVVSYASNGAVNPKDNIREEKQNLADFLHKRQIEQDKLHKLSRSREAERRVVFELEEEEDDGDLHLRHDDDFDDQVDDYEDSFKNNT